LSYFVGLKVSNHISQHPLKYNKEMEIFCKGTKIIVIASVTT